MGLPSAVLRRIIGLCTVLLQIRIATICTLPLRELSITFRRNADQFQGASTSLITTFQTVPIFQTVTSPTQTLFSTTCAKSPNDSIVRNPITSTIPTSTITPVVVAPVTLTRTSSSTDPSGNVIISTVAIVSTPSPDSTQTGSGSGGPNTTVIIGGAIGGVVVGLIALIGIIWCIKNKRRNGGYREDTWDEDEGHQAGAAKIKRGRPAAADYDPSQNHGVVSSGTPSPLLRGDQPSGVYSHSRSTSTATRYPTHRQSNSQTPFMLATSPPHSPPPQQQQPLPAAGAAGLDRTRTPIWARPSEQQGYFHQGYPSSSSDPNFTSTVTSTYSAPSRQTSATASSTQGLLSGYPPPSHTTANPTMAYPPGAAPPITGGRRSTYNEDHSPPLEQSQHWAARQPSQYQQSGPSSRPSSSTAKSELVAASPASVHTPSIKDRRINKGGLNGAPTPTSQAELPRVGEDAPPAYAQ